jgi:putative hydrolase of the HAD superfamily
MADAPATANGKVTTLFWDNGGVILTNGWDRDSRQKAVAQFDLDAKEFEERHELMLNDFEEGKVTMDEYIRRVIFHHRRDFTIDDFRQFMFDQSQPFPDSLEFLGKLARTRRYAMATLNNESLEINEYRIRTFHLRDYFEVFLSSCYLAMRKPTPEIYRQALKITQCEPEETVLIDDRRLNLEIAAEEGMGTIQFQNVEQLRADLAKLGVTADDQ